MDNSSDKSSVILISVVIPAYNEELFLADCLNSLKAQDFQGNFEIVVVDNNSSDRTSELARQCGARVIFEPQKGVCAAREAGTKAALGEIVVSTDADNIFASDWLSRIYQAFSLDQEVGIVAGPCKYRNAPWWGAFFPSLLFGSLALCFRLTGKVWYITACNTAFKKSIFPGYNTNLTQGGDELDFLHRLGKKGKAVFLANNYIFTSSRRLRRGMFYGMVITLLWYYAANYLVSLVIGKSLSIFQWPDFRTEKPKDNWAVLKRGAMAIVFALTLFLFQSHNASAHQAIVNTGHRIVNAGHRITHTIQGMPRISWKH